jgi:WD40 repeat protein
MFENSPYKGLIPFGEEDARYFFGRDRERRVISAALRASRLTVLYGESGVGKSSVLAAGVCHDLRDDPEYVVVLFSNWHDDPIAGLIDATRESLSTLPSFSLSQGKGQSGDLGAVLQDWTEVTKRSLLIVLDQFEEYFEYHWNDRGPSTFREELPRLLNRTDLPVNFLFSVRQDSLSLLDRFKGAVPTLFDNLLRIEHLGMKAAQSAIVNPLRRFNEDLLAGRYSNSATNLHPIEIDDQVAAQVVKQISAEQGEEPENVQAPYLQLVMTRWWEREIDSKSQSMRPETLHELGGVKAIVERYLEDTLLALSLGEKEIVAEAFRYMVTPTGRKIAQTTSDLINSLSSLAPVTESNLENILGRLQAARLLRRVPPPRGSLSNEPCYEFAHDMVAMAASEWQRQFRRTQQIAVSIEREKEANRRAAEQTRLAELEREVASKAKVAAIESEKRAEAERDRAEEQSRQVKRFRLLAGVLAIILLVALGAGIFALLQRSLARARQLAVAATLAESADPEVSVLFAAQSVAANWVWGHTLYPEAEDLLHRAIMASRVRTIMKGHAAAVTSVAWSPDGSRLATGSWDNTAKIWDAKSGKEVLTLSGHDRLVADIAWSHNGNRLATGSWDQTVKVWDATSGTAIFTLSGHAGLISSVAWSPDDTRLATGNGDAVAIVWDGTSGKEFCRLSAHVGRITGIAWSPDGKRLATSAGRSAEVWDVASGRELYSLRGHSGLVASVAWSLDGKRLATGSWDQTAKIWDTGNGKELFTLTGHEDTVFSVSWSPDGERLATGSWDSTAKVWDTGNGKELFTLKGHGGIVASVAWNPQGDHLATGSGDGTAKIWDAGSPKEILTLSGHAGSVASIAWSPKNESLAAASGSEVILWDTDLGKKLRVFSGGSGPIASVAWSPDGKRLATASGSAAVLWDVATGQELFPLRGESESITASVSWSPDGKLLATASNKLGKRLGHSATAWDGNAVLWNASSGKELSTLSGDSGRVESVAWSPDGKRLATGNGSKVLVWSVVTGKRLLTIAHDDSEVNAWDAAKGKQPSAITVNGGLVRSLAWSPDGSRLAIANSSVVSVWDARKGNQVATLSGHEDVVVIVVWSPDGQRLATGSRDNTVRVWDARTGTERLTLSGHGDSVTSVAWSPDGKRLASGSVDERVQIYATDIRDLMELARQRVTAYPRVEACKLYLNEDKCPPVPALSSWY